MRVRYTRRALADRKDIFDDLKARNPEAARTVVGHIIRRVSRLSQNPERGQKTNEPGVLTMWLVPHPYRIFYRVDDVVAVLHIRHTSRREWSGD